MPTAADKWGNSRKAYAAGKLSMVVGPSLVASTMEAVPSGVALEPFAPGKTTRNTMMTIQSFLISSQSKNPDLAFELIKYLTDEATAKETLIETGSMVVQNRLNRTLFGQGVNIKDFRSVFEASVAQPVFYAYAGVLAEPWELITEAVDKAIEMNEEPIESIMANYVPRINAALLGR
jgi:ABC-type glycerol-3-phosphate transport system substrate-binding protein